MACDVTRGKAALECKNGTAGIKAIYVANYDDYAFVTSSTSSGHTLTDLGTLSEVFKFELKNSANNFQEDITTSRDNGTTFYNQVITFVLTKLSSEMAFQLKMLAWGRPIIFLEGYSGEVVVVGMEFGCEITGNGQLGGNIDGANLYNLTATGMEREPAFFLTPASITALKALVSTNNIE